MRVCPICRQQFPAGSGFCPYDGHRLQDLLDQTGPVAAERDELLGQVLDERYRLEGRLGEGGMGVVYAGRHVIIDKPVAVKILRREYSSDPRQSERFLREARAASRIGHPNIVDITDFGKLTNGQIYFVMEFLIGHTLAWEVRRFGSLPVERTLKLALQICRALSAAHAKGIVHRDLKPENIFIVNPSTVDTSERTAGHPDDTIKLLDFGIAKFAWDSAGKRLTRAGSVFGTPQYMSPEQAAGQDADHRVDLYSLGCIFYEMLTGELPFSADTFMGTLEQHIFAQPIPPRQRKPELDLDTELEAVILRALEKDPDARFQSSTELHAALERYARARQGGSEAALEGPATVPEPVEPEPVAEPRRDEAAAAAPAPVPLGAASAPPLAPGRRLGPLFWLPLVGLAALGGGLVVWRMATTGPTPAVRDAGRPAADRQVQAPLPAARADAARPAPRAVPDAAVAKPDHRRRVKPARRRADGGGPARPVEPGWRTNDAGLKVPVWR